MRPMVTNIQRYSIHDGEGIRTTVFFKGCPLHCLWCHNPETQRREQELMFYEERCTGCGHCAEVCRNQAVVVKDGICITDRDKCKACNACVEECLSSARELAGKYYEIKDLVEELEKDQMFYEESGGGVTLSGGEALALPREYLTQLVQRLDRKGISIAVDTCGCVPYSQFQAVLPYVDIFLYDLKEMDEKRHLKYTGASNRLPLENLARLGREGKRIFIRLPVIGGMNDTREHVEAVGRFLLKEKIPAEKIHLLPYHNTGAGKYGRLAREYEESRFMVPSEKKLEELEQILKKLGFLNTVIGG